MQRLAVGLLGLGAVLATGHATANDTMSQLGAGGLEFVASQLQRTGQAVLLVDGERARQCG